MFPCLAKLSVIPLNFRISGMPGPVLNILSMNGRSAEHQQKSDINHKWGCPVPVITIRREAAQLVITVTRPPSRSPLYFNHSQPASQPARQLSLGQFVIVPQSAALTFTEVLVSLFGCRTVINDETLQQCGPPSHHHPSLLQYIGSFFIRLPGLPRLLPLL